MSVRTRAVGVQQGAGAGGSARFLTADELDGLLQDVVDRYHLDQIRRAIQPAERGPNGTGRFTPGANQFGRRTGGARGGTPGRSLASELVKSAVEAGMGAFAGQAREAMDRDAPAPQYGYIRVADGQFNWDPSKLAYVSGTLQGGSHVLYGSASGYFCSTKAGFPLQLPAHIPFGNRIIVTSDVPCDGGGNAGVEGWYNATCFQSIADDAVYDPDTLPILPDHWPLPQRKRKPGTSPDDGPEEQADPARPPGAPQRTTAKPRSSPWPQARKAGNTPPHWPQPVSPFPGLDVLADADAVDRAQPAAEPKVQAVASTATQGLVARLDTARMNSLTKRERKINTPMWRRWQVVRFIEATLETSDSMGAIYKALPKSVRQACRQQWVEREFERGVKRPARVPPFWVKAQCIADNWRHLDAEGVVRELLWEEAQDHIYGAVGKLKGAAASKVYRRDFRGLGYEGASGSDVSHPLNPRLPLDALEQAVTLRAQREARQAANQDAIDFQFAERQRRRDNWRTERNRRAVYRSNFGGRSRR